MKKIENKQPSGFAIASLILGIFSLILGWIPFFGWILILLALIFGFKALNQTKNTDDVTGRGMAIAGIVLGFAALAMAIIVILATMIGFVAIIGSNVTVEEKGQQNLDSTISPTGVSGTWAGSATLTNNCANPACEYAGTMSPPSVTLDIEQDDSAVTGTITLNFDNVKTLISGQGCQAMSGQGAISNGKISGTRLTFNDPAGNFWSLNIISGSMQGTVSSNLPGCTGLQTKAGISNPVSLTRQ